MNRGILVGTPFEDDSDEQTTHHPRSCETGRGVGRNRVACCEWPGCGQRADATVCRRSDTGDRVFAPMSSVGDLKTARSGTLGVLVPSLRNPIFADAVQGIERAAEAGGYRILLTSSNYLPEKEAAAIDVLLCNRVEGLVLTVADESSSQALEFLNRSNVPFVLVFNPASSAKHSTVTIDNFAAAQDIVSRLVRMGHRRIAMIAGDFEASDRSNLRSRRVRTGAGRRGTALGSNHRGEFRQQGSRAALSGPDVMRPLAHRAVLLHGHVRHRRHPGIRSPGTEGAGRHLGGRIRWDRGRRVHVAESCDGRATGRGHGNARCRTSARTSECRRAGDETDAAVSVASWGILGQTQEDDRTERDSGVATKGTIRL